jgi:hypothetical protein
VNLFAFSPTHSAPLASFPGKLAMNDAVLAITLPNFLRPEATLDTIFTNPLTA